MYSCLLQSINRSGGVFTHFWGGVLRRCWSIGLVPCRLPVVNRWVSAKVYFIPLLLISLLPALWVLINVSSTLRSQQISITQITRLFYYFILCGLILIYVDTMCTSMILDLCIIHRGSSIAFLGPDNTLDENLVYAIVWTRTHWEKYMPSHA